MPAFPAAHRLVTTVALVTGFALVGVAAGGVHAVDAELERATFEQRPATCDGRVALRSEAATPEPCPVAPVVDRDVEL